MQEHLAAAQKLIDNKEKIEADLKRLEVVEKELNKLNEERGEIRARLKEVFPWMKRTGKALAVSDERLVELITERFGSEPFDAAMIRDCLNISHSRAYKFVREMVAVGKMRIVENGRGVNPTKYVVIPQPTENRKAE